ncbi:hypothetical protein BV25DRAFT_1829194 [Artomyces pyxidatus]|uniref:Uncharacterized protein n=1 Tax=Artomyces pyxidatus TaxID=48021 RepID=A0ACB8STN4_9AGAM|nr:hypothetical protein BV25DRAFT_1829194 [Artomyces pyxidatus]
MDTAGSLVFLLFIPILWIIWIWMIVSKPAIIFHTSQVFFNFLAMCCFASVAAFQAKWGVGPSGLSGFALFVSITGILLSLFLLLVPVVYEKYDKLTRLARALKEVRVSFILVGAGTTFSLLIAFITTISAWTQPGCKDASKDPNAKGKGSGFQNGLVGWCSTKKAGAIFFWLAFGFWAASLTLAVLDWRSGKSLRPRDPPFTHPTEQDDADIESTYDTIPPIRRTASTDDGTAVESPFSDANRYSGASSTVVPSAGGYSSPASKYTIPSAPQPRASFDSYGAFSDPAPSGFDAPRSNDAPAVSRTMQYADPYAAVRASVASSGATTPPSYTSYQGYR